VRRLLAATALTSAAAVLSVLPATAASPTPSGQVAVDRVVRDVEISESSGLSPSLRHPGVLWTHNDSGHPAKLFAIGPDGRTRAAVQVTGAPARDWEAIASYRDRSNRPMIVVGDIGDGRASRSSVALVVLPEPALRATSVRPERVIRLTYPTGPTDAEALLVDPDGGRAFIVSKGLGGTVFEVPSRVWTGESGSAKATLIQRAGVPLIFVTDGVMGPGGHPLLRTYGELAVLPPIDHSTSGGTLQPLATLRLPGQKQGESLALRDTGTVLVGSEGQAQPVLRVPLPATMKALLAGPVQIGPSASGSRRSGASSADTGGVPAAPGRLLPLPGGATGAAGVGLVALLALLALVRRRRRSRTP
jgi:hypothetical protein